MSKENTNTSVEIAQFTIQSGSQGKLAWLRLVWQALGGSRLLYLCGILAIALEAFFTFSSPLVLKLALDSVLGTQPVTIPQPMESVTSLFFGASLGGHDASGMWIHRDWVRENLWVCAVALVVCTGLQALFGWVSSISINRASEDSARRLRNRLYAHVQYLPWESLLRAQSGDWLQRCSSDVETARRFLAQQFFEICRTLFLVITAVPIMLYLSSDLTLWGIGVIPVILVFSIVFFQRVQKAFLKMDESEGRLSNVIQENVTGIRVVRAFARQSRELERFGSESAIFRDTTFKVILYLAWYWGFSSFLCMVQTGVVMGAGLVLNQAGILSLGTLVLFLTYEQQLLFPIRHLGRVLADSGKAMVALGRIGELLALQREDDVNMTSNTAITPQWCYGSIEFRNVSFTYPDGTEVLKKVSFKIDAGQTLAILGPTGSGKTTLVHLLARLYEPTQGSILLGGMDIREIPKRELRTWISYVTQEPFLFGRSIKDNIAFGKVDASLEEVQESARVASFQGVAENFRDGWNTLVGERGVTLSGGQRQRLALARSFVRKSPVLVLDDSLSAVDTETDAAIRAEIARREGDTTMIIIAHRITTLSEADRIVVIEHGMVSDIGTHQELVARAGLYQRLYALQSQEANGASESEGVA